MSNILFALPVKWTFIPYFGVGLGGYQELVKGEVPALSGTPEEVVFKDKSSGMAYQGIVGLNLIHHCNMNCDLEYHFLDAIADTDSIQKHTLAVVGSWIF